MEDGNLIDLPANEVVRGVLRLPEARTPKFIGNKDGGKRHGDGAIALALAYYASRELNQPPLKIATFYTAQLT